MSRRYLPIRHSLESGDVTVDAFHYGDGCYMAIFKCRACGDEATQELRLPKAMVNPKWQWWAREHNHP